MQKVREVQIAQKVAQIVRCKEKRVDLKENGAGRPHRRWGADRQTVEYADDAPERKLGVNLTGVGEFPKDPNCTRLRLSPGCRVQKFQWSMISTDY